MTFADENGISYELDQDGSMCDLFTVFGQSRTFVARASLGYILVLSKHLGIKWDIKY